MNLINWKNSEIEITPEAYGIKAFRAIWKSDRSKYKERAIILLTALYFMYDPRSEYRHYIDEDIRLEKVKEGVGIESKWKPDKQFLEARDIYKELVVTTSSLILESNRIAVDKLRKYLTDLDMAKDIDDKGKPIHTLNTVTKAISDLTKLSIDIHNSEKTINKEIEEKSLALRGKGNKTIGDDGLNFMEE